MLQQRRSVAAVLMATIVAIIGFLFEGRAAQADVNDYPRVWAEAPKDSVFDDWRLYNRECVSFVAWRLHSRNGFELPFHDNASAWASRAQAFGFAVNNTPAVGAVAWFSFGHVAWVESVSVDGRSVHIEEYNYDYRGNYSHRDIATTEVSKFIHFKDLTPSGAGSLGQPADANHDGVADVMVVPFVGTGSGKTEVHALDGNGYNGWLFNMVSGENGKVARNGYHLFADLNGDHASDLYEISMDPNGTVNVHVKAGPNFTASIGDWATPIRSQSPFTAKVALGDANNDGRPDLYVFTLRQGNWVDVHILNGRDFTSSLGDFATPAGVSTMNNYEILAQDYNRDGTLDMYLVSLQGGGAHADVHVLDGRGFHTWLGHWVTPFGASDVTHVRVFSGDKNKDGQPDLYFAVYNGGAGKIDLLVLDGRSFANWVGMWRTAAGASSFAVADIALAG